MALAGCVKVTGGSVEVNWIVRTDDGRAVGSCNCADPFVARVRIRLVPEGGDPGADDFCAGRPECAFACERQTGATPFEIPAGRYGITVVPLGAEGEDLTASGSDATIDHTAQAPAPILRDVVEGQVTEIEALQIVAACAPVCSGSNSSASCSQ